jgi:N-acyl homoserine lactone hydrolase
MPKTDPFFQYAVKIAVVPEEEIGVRLADMGIDPARDVRQLLMTHLHHDHTGGLHHFPTPRSSPPPNACVPPGASVGS